MEAVGLSSAVCAQERVRCLQTSNRNNTTRVTQLVKNLWKTHRHKHSQGKGSMSLVENLVSTRKYCFNQILLSSPLFLPLSCLPSAWCWLKIWKSWFAHFLLSGNNQPVAIDRWPWYALTRLRSQALRLLPWRGQCSAVVKVTLQAGNGLPRACPLHDPIWRWHHVG